MTLDFNKSFKKQFGKLDEKQSIKVRQTLEVFLANPYHPILRNHALRGKWLGYHSISAGGDLRLHFKLVGKDTAIFVAIGTHSQLYK